MMSRALMTLVSLQLFANDPAKPNDSWLTMKARLSILSTEGVKSKDVHIDTDYGVVTLYGKVASNAAKTALERAVAGLDGVARVDNQLQVVPPTQEKVVAERDDAISKRVEEMLEKRKDLGDVKVLSVDKGVVTLGGEVNDMATHVRTVELVDRVDGVRRVQTRLTVKNDGPTQYHTAAKEASLSDAWITSQVKLRLIGNEHVPSNDVHVDTWDGIVTLWGRVDSAKAKNEAGNEAKKVETVVRVHNDLVVDPKMTREKVADKDIESDVKRLLAKDSLEDVRASVKNGVVKLTGKVDNQGERVRAAMVSRNAKGARAVKNELTVQKNEVALPR